MPDLLFTEAEWPQITSETVTQMSRHVERFTTPISRVVADDEGEHWGSGSYCEFLGQRFLLTNEHVARELQTQSLAHKFFGDDHYFRFRNQFAAFGEPQDVAMSRIEESEWKKFPHNASAITDVQFAPAHRLVKGELLFMAGYSGVRSRFLFGNLITPGTPYLARECQLPSEQRCDNNFHFALEYNPELASSVGGSSQSLPLPAGLSGSLVWNTRRVEMRMRGRRTWTPEDALVTGIVWGWPSDTCLFATKIEHMALRELVTKASAL